MADIKWLFGELNMPSYDYVVTHYVKEKNCFNCEFACYSPGKGFVCAGNDKYYGSSINSISFFEGSCSDWELSFVQFQKLCRSLDKGHTPRKI